MSAASIAALISATSTPARASSCAGKTCDYRLLLPPRPEPASNQVSIETHARREIAHITRQFDWERQRKPIPREAIEELMVLAFVRGATYAIESARPPSSGADAPKG